MSCYFNGLSGLELAKQQQDEQHYQNNAEKAHSGVAVAVAVAAEPAAEAAQQENNQDDDEYQSKRHGTLPNGRPANGHPPSRHPEQSITRSLVPSEEPGNAGRFRCTRCYSCAFYQYKVRTRPRVQRAPGIPHALYWGGR